MCGPRPEPHHCTCQSAVSINSKVQPLQAGGHGGSGPCHRGPVQLSPMSQGDKREAVIYPKGAHCSLCSITAGSDCTTRALTRSPGPPRPAAPPCSNRPGLPRAVRCRGDNRRGR